MRSLFSAWISKCNWSCAVVSCIPFLLARCVSARLIACLRQVYTLPMPNASFPGPMQRLRCKHYVTVPWYKARTYVPRFVMRISDKVQAPLGKQILTHTKPLHFRKITTILTPHFHRVTLPQSPIRRSNAMPDSRSNKTPQAYGLSNPGSQRLAALDTEAQFSLLVSAKKGTCF